MLLRSFRRLLSAPPIDDPNDARTARALLIIIVLSMMANFGYITLLIVSGAITWGEMSACVLVFLAQTVVLLLVHRAYVRPASLLLIGLFWGSISVYLLAVPDLQTPVLNGYNFVILMAGLLLSNRWAFLFAAFSAFMSWYISGNPPAPTMQLNQWFFLSLEYLAMAFLVMLIRHNVRENLAQVLENRQTLHQQNVELQAQINERRKAEVELNHSREQYKELMELLPVATIVHGANGKILYANSASANLLAASIREELIGRLSLDFVPQEYQTVAAMQFIRAELGKLIGPVEYKMRRLDQELIDVQIYSMPIAFQDHLALLDVMLDVTGAKRAQQQLLDAEILKFEVGKEREIIDLKERFISMVSHEFRNPLTTIQTSRGILEMYADRLTPQQRLDHLNKIGTQVKFMAEMLEDVLTISRGQAKVMDFRPEMLDLEILCRDIFRQLEQQDGGKHSFAMEVTGDLNSVGADPKLVGHIVVNLLTNAVKYSPAGKQVALHLERQADTVTLRVRDEGIGIPLEDQARLFQPFHRGRNVNTIKGTGLGLAIVKTSIEAHRGNIAVESKEGSGTTFVVSLPLSTAAVSS